MPTQNRNSLERRALVAIACYLLVCQAFFAALAIGFAAGGARGAGDIVAVICHGLGAPANNTGDADRPAQPPCDSCVFAACGPTLLPESVVLAAVSPATGSLLAAAPRGFLIASFDPRDGRSRAPPSLG